MKKNLITTIKTAPMDTPLHVYEIAYRETYKAVTIILNNAYTPYLADLLKSARVNKSAVMMSAVTDTEHEETKKHEITRKKLAHARKVMNRKKATNEERTQALRDAEKLSNVSELENDTIKDLRSVVRTSTDFADLMQEFIIAFYRKHWRAYNGMSHAKVNGTVNKYGVSGRDAWELVARCGVGRSAVYKAVHGERGLNTVDTFTTKHFTATEEEVTSWLDSHKAITNADADEKPIKYQRSNGKDLESMSLKNGVIVHTIHYRTIKAHDYMAIEEHGEIVGYRRTDNRTAEKFRAIRDIETLKATATDRERVLITAYLDKHADEIAYNFELAYTLKNRDKQSHDPKRFKHDLDRETHKVRMAYAWEVVERETGTTYTEETRGKIVRRMKKYAHDTKHLEHREQVHNSLLDSGFLQSYDNHYAHMMTENRGLPNGQTASTTIKSEYTEETKRNILKCCESLPPCEPWSVVKYHKSMIDTAKDNATKHYTDVFAWVTRSETLDHENRVTVGEPWNVPEPNEEHAKACERSYMDKHKAEPLTDREREELEQAQREHAEELAKKQAQAQETAERMARADELLSKFKPQAEPQEVAPTRTRAKVSAEELAKVRAEQNKVHDLMNRHK